MDPLHEPRLVALESLVMHLQHDVETLNSVILEQQKELTLLRTILKRLDDRVSRVGETSDVPFDPSLEKPPHY